MRDRPQGRTLREGAPPPKGASWYTPLFVFGITVVAFVVAYALGASKLELGYTIYGTLAIFGILVPSILAFGRNRLVGFPTLFYTVDQLRQRLAAVALILIAGLSILTVHLAFYPWPDIAHESATFAGLTSHRARVKAERELRRLRPGLPPLTYSTQARGVVEGRDSWFVRLLPPRLRPPRNEDDGHGIRSVHDVRTSREQASALGPES